MTAEDRIGHNEAVFRELNERIEAAQWPGEREDPVAFRCECASLRCNLLIALTVENYERVRANPRHFVVATGHEIPEVELVIEREPAYVVVEKVGEAARAAEETDPRED